MAILSGFPILNCQSIEKTLDFYQKILQFVVVKKREANDAPTWVHLMNGNTTLMLQSIETNSATKNHSTQNISLYFFINNISELHHYIKVNYSSVSEIVATDYQVMEFSLRDPEGNEVTVGQSVNM